MSAGSGARWTSSPTTSRGWRRPGTEVRCRFVRYRKAAGRPRVEYEEAIEEAPCFGRMDGKVNALDEERSMLWFAPRRPRTGWSRPNKQRVERLLALAEYPQAARNFETFPGSVKRRILECIATAKRPETRAARIAAMARLADETQRAN